MHRTTSRTLTVAVAMLACLAALLVAATAAPGSAATTTPVARAGAMWQAQQKIGSHSVAVLMQWARVKGATTYEVDYAPSTKAINGAGIQKSKKKRTLKVSGTKASVQARRVTGLKPGTIYCFQVRGRHGKKVGYRGPAHCKVTAELNRARKDPFVQMVVGTFNVCSGKCGTLLPWSRRRALVRQRILEMNVGSRGRAADVVAVQEANEATAWLREDALAGTFTQACQTIEGTSHDNQSVFVRNKTYEVVRGSQGGLRFDGAQYDDPTHGACWARVKERASGLEAVVVGLHLRDGTGTANDRVRRAETAAILDRVAKAHPDTPVVLAGDTNSTRTRALDGPRVALEGAGFRDAYEESALYRSRPYRNSACGATGAVRKSITWGDHIDRVFVPADVHVSSWEVDYRIRTASRYVTPLASDHNPVVISLLFPPPADDAD